MSSSDYESALREIDRLQHECDLRREQHLDACRKIDRLEASASVDAEKVRKAIKMLRDGYGSNFPESITEKAISLLEEALRK